jgi:AraC-like DNA-binding protein
VYDLPGTYIREIVELAEPKVAHDVLLRGLPTTYEALTDPTTRVPLRVCEAIVARAIELTGEPALGIALGMRMKVSSHGFLGFAAMTAATVREALELAARFATTRTSAIGLVLDVEGALASVTIEERTPLDGIREVVVLALVIGLWQMGQTLTGRLLAGVGECAFPEPAYVAAMPHDNRLLFDRPAHRLVFPADELALPLVTADPTAKRLAAAELERELATRAEAELATRIRGLLAAGEPAPPSLDDVAKTLHMAPRTLKRRLAELGTSFSELRDSQRRQRALLLLDDRALSIHDVATRLGYTELPNFTRAFRKWTGMTPAAYRGGPTARRRG